MGHTVVALIQILKEKRSATKANEIGGHYLVDMVCLLVSRKQKEKLSEGWFRVVTFQQLCKHSGIYDSRFREGNRNLSPTCDKNCQKIVFLKHRFKQFPNSLTLFEKSNFCPKIQFWQNSNIFTSFSPKLFLTIFLVKSKLSTAKKSKTAAFARVFAQNNSTNQSWIWLLSI